MNKHISFNSNNSFNQLYIWKNNELGCSEKEFENALLAVLSIRIKFYKVVKKCNTTDLLFYIHNEDVDKLCDNDFGSCIKKYNPNIDDTYSLYNQNNLLLKH